MYNPCQRARISGPLYFLIGLLFFLVSPALVVLAWRSFRKDSKFVLFSIDLVERVVEWSGAIFSVVFFALAFSGTGRTRIYVILAAFCNCGPQPCNSARQRSAQQHTLCQVAVENRAYHDLMARFLFAQ
jgi:hypothetical protein